MRDWVRRLVADKDGNPNEHIVFAIIGILGLNLICGLMLYWGHQITLSDYGMAQGAIVGGGGAAQFLSRGS